VTYYGIWVLVTYVGWKLTEIPYGAWSFGLSRDYVQRARIQLWRAMATLLGGLAFFIVPFATHALGLTPTTELYLHTLSFTAMVIVVCVPAINLYALAKVPDGEAAPPPEIEKKGQNWRVVLQSVVHNGPLIRLLAAFIPVTLLTSMSTSTTYLFVNSYLGLSKQYAALMLVVMPFGLLGLPFWGWMCLHFERHRVAAVALLLAAVAYAGQAFVPVGEAGLIPMMILNPIGAFTVVAVAVCIPAMMGDIVDYGRLQSGEDMAGIYSATLAFLSRSLGGLGGALGLAIAGWLSFDAAASQQSAQGAFAIKLVSVWLPVLGVAIAAPILWTFPITRAKQEATLAAIKANEMQSTTVD
ncbi:MAG: MFS transporter, partial [Stenotrophobium sp.]